jgi:DNA-binding FadR family transcriptional regulator
MAAAARVGSDYDAYDYRFHKAMAESSHNSVLRRIYPVILEGIERGYEHTAHMHGSVDAALGFHRDILDAIRAGNASQARRITEMHIRQTMQDINGSTKGELT